MKQSKKKMIVLMACLCVALGGAACAVSDTDSADKSEPTSDSSYVSESNSSSENGECVHSGGTPTCTQKPTCSICGEEYGEALDHAYDVENIAWTWAEDGSSAMATITCKNDATHTVAKAATVTSEVTTPAGCEEMGTTTYTATIEYNGNTYTATKDVQDVAAKQHAYDVENIAWTWAEDGSSAMATITCKNDATHTVAKAATVTSEVTTPAGCEEMGTTTYTAMIEYNGNTYTATKDVQDVAAKQHVYGAWESNGDGTHTKTCANDSGHTETLNCNGGTATCQVKAVCVDCGEEYGNYGKHDVQWIKDDAAKDVKKCATEGCMEVEKEFIKTVTAKNQELMSTNSAATIDVAGCSAYESIESITLGNVNLGTNPSAIDLTQVTDKALHGAQTIILTVKDAEGETHEVSVPVTIVTQMVSTVEELRAVTRTVTDNTNKAIFGYYKLANDINCTASPDWAGFHNNVSFNNDDISGFRGTLDGDGHTLTGFIHANGLFNQVNFGAVIKDVTFVSVKCTGSATAVIGNMSRGATYENVNFVLYNDGKAAYPKSVIFGQGYANVMKNVSIKVYAGADSTSEYAAVGSLFGNWHWTSGTAYADKYENVMVYCASLGAIHYEGADTAITSAEGVKFSKTDVLAQTQEVLMTKDTSLALDLGKYATGYTVDSISLGNIDFGSDPSKIDLTKITDVSMHGVQKFIVNVYSDNEIVSVQIPVTLITKEISTVEDLRAITKTANYNNAIVGYYRLANDINCTASPDWAGFSNSGSFNWQSPEAGFRGTLDGNGYTLTGFAHNQGLFFTIGTGAVIKNITFKSTRYSGANDRLFGIASYNATYENVTIELNGDNVPTGHLLFANGCKNNTFKNVSITVKGTDGNLTGVTTVFGSNFEGNTFESVEIYAASVAKLGTNSSSVDVTSATGVTIKNTL